MYYQELKQSWPLIEKYFVVTNSNESNSEVIWYPYIVPYEFKSPSQLFNVAEWADDNCKEDWLIGRFTSAFMSEEDALLFKLTWL